MNDTGWTLSAAVIGLAAGFFHFGLLYFTLRRLRSAGRPAWLAAVSFAARMAVMLLVLYLLVRGGEWQRGLAFLAGFIVTRTLLVRRWRPERPAEQRGSRERKGAGSGG
jgi:F1F0 ATPase subunit 2